MPQRVLMKAYSIRIRSHNHLILSLRAIRKFTRWRTSIINKVSKYIPLEEDEIEYDDQSIVFNVWVCERSTFALHQATSIGAKEGRSQRCLRIALIGGCTRMHKACTNRAPGTCRTCK